MQKDSQWVPKEDFEDYNQEVAIQKWLESLPDKEGAGHVDCKYINSKGNIRVSGIRGSISLDQKITEDSAGTFADIIPGFDGRDLYRGEDPGADEILDAYLACLGLDEETTEWAIKTLKLWADQNKLPLERLMTDLEWEKL